MYSVLLCSLHSTQPQKLQLYITPFSVTIVTLFLAMPMGSFVFGTGNLLSCTGMTCSALRFYSLGVYSSNWPMKAQEYSKFYGIFFLSFSLSTTYFNFCWLSCAASSRHMTRYASAACGILTRHPRWSRVAGTDS